MCASVFKENWVLEDITGKENILWFTSEMPLRLQMGGSEIQRERVYILWQEVEHSDRGTPAPIAILWQVPNDHVCLQARFNTLWRLTQAAQWRNKRERKATGKPGNSKSSHYALHILQMPVQTTLDNQGTAYCLSNSTFYLHRIRKGRAGMMGAT